MARLPYPNYTSGSRPAINIIKLFAHSPSTVDQWAAVGTAHYRSLELSRKLREVATVYLAARFQSSYESSHHVSLSAREGVTETQREMLREAALKEATFFAHGGGKGVFEERERAMLAFLETVVRGPEVSDGLWEATRKHFSDREIVELLSLQGFYYTIARVGSVLKVDLDDFAVQAKAKL